SSSPWVRRRLRSMICQPWRCSRRTASSSPSLPSCAVVSSRVRGGGRGGPGPGSRELGGEGGGAAALFVLDSVARPGQVRIVPSRFVDARRVGRRVDQGSEMSDLLSSSTLTSLNVTTRTERTKRLER